MGPDYQKKQHHSTAPNSQSSWYWGRYSAKSLKHAVCNSCWTRLAEVSLLVVCMNFDNDDSFLSKKQQSCAQSNDKRRSLPWQYRKGSIYYYCKSSVSGPSSLDGNYDAYLCSERMSKVLHQRSSHATIIMRLTSSSLHHPGSLCVYKHSTVDHLVTPIGFSFHE